MWTKQAAMLATLFLCRKQIIKLTRTVFTAITSMTFDIHSTYIQLQNYYARSTTTKKNLQMWIQKKKKKCWKTSSI